MSFPVRVIKLGGSLFAEPNLRQLAAQWLDANTGRKSVVVVGGGLWADGVRDAFTRFGLSEEFCHWLCVDLLEQTSALAAQILGLPMECRYSAVASRLPAEDALILSIGDYLREAEPKSDLPLPHRWSVTTDSIAAQLARQLSADELVLWKSTLPGPDHRTLPDWSDSGFVDDYFPIAAQNINVRAVDLLTGCERFASGEDSTS